MDDKVARCPDCQVTPGQLHEDGCDVARMRDVNDRLAETMPKLPKDLVASLSESDPTPEQWAATMEQVRALAAAEPEMKINRRGVSAEVGESLSRPPGQFERFPGDEPPLFEVAPPQED